MICHLSKILFNITLFVSLCSATTTLAEKRLALVIGNGAYTSAPGLVNPVNDARAMARKFEELGFETIAGFDLDKAGMDRVIRNFSRAARDSDLNVLFYAGHGMSVDGTNYLIPVDAQFQDSTALDFEAVPVDFITRQMSYADSVNLVFLDACRDNPLSRTLSRSMGSTRSSAINGGLSEMKINSSGKGMAIAFATSPGEVALDGDGLNSPFTSALLRHIGAANTDITEVFSRVTGDVYKATDTAQRPWLNASLTGSVVLNPVAQTRVVPVNTGNSGDLAASSRSDRLEEQKLIFQLARDTGAVEDYQAYLDSFPNGIFANNARRSLKKLRGQTGAGSTTVASRTSFAAPDAGAKSAAINENGPLILPVSNTVRNYPADASTEAAMNLNRKMRGDIQARLNASGNNVGGVDGRWGGKTRKGITNWQYKNGLNPTGFLNKHQMQILASQTEGRFTPYTPPAKVAKKKKSRSSKSKSRSKKRTKKRNDGNAAAVILGIAAGVLLSK